MMVLVDTSIWVDHLRQSDPTLVALLQASSVLAHPFVMGELSLGGLHPDGDVLTTMHDLPQAQTATAPEMLHFVTQHALAGLGMGYVDAHLLAAVALTPGASLWTRDKRLHAAAARLGLAAGALH